MRKLPKGLILSGVIVRFEDDRFHALLSYTQYCAVQQSRERLEDLKRKEPGLEKINFQPIEEITGNGNFIADEITRLNIKAGFPVPALAKKS